MQLKLTLKSFSSYHINMVTTKILEKAHRIYIKVKGPIFLPKKTSLTNILRSPHINKDARDQIAIESHKVVLLLTQINKNKLKKLLKININPIVKILLQLTI
ncbi:30S ribosomal protein S10 [Candidatus Vidania fulgoroideae]|nr:30S ribosomal protein S10 [Candidatus Vidania fulgoroideae]